MGARSVLMVEPIGFAPNSGTADDNVFQRSDGFEPAEAEERARSEFEGAARALQEAGVEVVRFAGDPSTPDATFPNNWFSTHEEGRLVLYPMRSEARRRERRPDILAFLKSRYPDVIDLSAREERGEYLEGTGSMVLDRRNRVAYAGLSGRTSERTFRFWCERMGYDGVAFETEDRSGLPVYHTNVLMALGARWAVVCSECILRPAPVLSALMASGREVVEITRAQMAQFCGNVLELEGREGAVVAMSESAREGFTRAQLEALQRHAAAVPVPIPTIERFGGGSLRCMLAELY